MVEIYLERAKQLADARDLVENDDAYIAARALLAIHSGIAMNDALLSKLTGSAYRGEDHKQAARMTERTCIARHIDHSGIHQLKKLLQYKTQVSYSDQRTTSELASFLVVASERFQAWAYKRIEEVQ